MAIVSDETIVRVNVSTSDAAAPTTAQEAIDCTGYRFITVEVKVTGTDPSASITPLFWNSVFGVYMEGDAYTITVNSRLNVAVDSCDDLYFKIDDITGTNATFSISVRPAMI